MILNSSPSVRIGMCAAMLGALLAGCQMHRSPEDVRRGVSNVQAEVARGKVEVNSTLDALKNLRDANDAQLKNAFANYSKAVTTLEEKAAGVGMVFDMGEDRAKQYFAKWDKTISELGDDDLRNRAEDRKAGLQAEYDDAHKKIETLRANFRPFMAKLKDIQKSMAADMGPGGKSAAAPAINEALGQGNSVLKDIDAVTDALAKLES